MVITATLAIGAALVWVCLGVPIGVLSALRRGHVIDRVSLGFSLFFVSAPVFWLGVIAALAVLVQARGGTPAAGTTRRASTGSGPGWAT